MIPIVIMAIEDESDRDYITGLFLKNERGMYAMALKIVKEHHTACDMVSEACLKMIEKIGYLREISVQKQTPYILSIVKNTSLMYLRQRRSENNWLVDDERILDYCLRIMENAKATEAQKLQKYNLAAEIKRKYEERQRVKKASDESVEKIRANRNYSREYIGKCVEGIRSKQKEEQRRIYNSASEKIRRLEQAVAAERPSEAFDFGSQKFTNALKLIETGGKNLPEDVQRMIAAQFRYCPDALNVLSPLMSAAGMQYGNEAIQFYDK